MRNVDIPALHAHVCECGRGMIPDIRMEKTFCYACLKEMGGDRVLRDFDPTGKQIQHSSYEIMHAALVEVLSRGSQKATAEAMNVTPAFLGDVIQGRRAISEAISKYYWLERSCLYVPRFHRNTEVDD